MKFLRLAPVLVMTAACATSPAPQPAPAAPEEAIFTLRREANVIATERFRRTNDLLEAELTVPNGSRLSYTAQLRPDASVSQIEVRQFAPGAAPDAVPAQRSSAAFQGDSVMLSQTRGEATQTAQRAVVAGIVPYINPSPSLMEQIVRRARAMGGERVEVPVWLPSASGQMATATVAFPAADSAQITMGDVQVRLRVGPQGRVLGGAIPAQGLTLERAAAEPR